MWWILQLDPPFLQLVCYSFLLRNLPDEHHQDFIYKQFCCILKVFFSLGRGGVLNRELSRHVTIFR